LPFKVPISSAKPITQNHESFGNKEIYDYAKASSQSSTHGAVSSRAYDPVGVLRRVRAIPPEYIQ
jgi:hypothetical protein